MSFFFALLLEHLALMIQISVLGCDWQEAPVLLQCQNYLMELQQECRNVFKTQILT